MLSNLTFLFLTLRRISKKILLLGLLIYQSEECLQAEPRQSTSTNCFSHEFSDDRVEYCVTHDPESKSQDVLYYFHGIFGDKNSWENDGRGIREEWKRQRIQAPTVVTISAGKAWLLNDENILMMSGLLPVFINEVFPSIEKRLQKLGYIYSPSGKKYLYGISMGGFNAIQLFTRRPGWFHKVALVSPAIATVSPFASSFEIGSYVLRNHANLRDVMVALSLASLYFPNDETWSEASPMELANKLNFNNPPLYLGITSRDSYGFQEGSSLFADIARNRGVVVDKSEYIGDHAFVKHPEIVSFFAK